MTESQRKNIKLLPFNKENIKERYTYYISNNMSPFNHNNKLDQYRFNELNIASVDADTQEELTPEEEIQEIPSIPQEHSRKHHHKSKRRRHKKKRSKRDGNLGCLSGSLLVLLAILIFSGVYVWKIWNSVERTAEKIQVPRAETHQQIRNAPVQISNLDPFSVLILGIDTGEYGRTEKGRSDVMVVATVNPKSKTISLTSIPRDTYTEIIGKDTKDKINHAYAFGGTGMSANTVQALLEIPIDYTVSANMKDFKEIVDAVGGIVVTPPQSFSQGGFDFVGGKSTQMNGTMALEYMRNRYDSGGDYGRQDRARQVVYGIVQSAIELDSIVNYQSILDSLSGNITVDMSKDEIIKLITDYRSSAENVHEYQLQGQGQKIDGVYYEIIDDESLNSIKQSLKKELDINE